MMAGQQLHFLAGHGLAGGADHGPQRDRHFRADAEAVIVGRQRRSEKTAGGSLQPDQHLGAGHRQALAGPDVEGHACQRQVSIHSRTAANVSTCESGATPFSWR